MAYEALSCPMAPLNKLFEACSGMTEPYSSDYIRYVFEDFTETQCKKIVAVEENTITPCAVVLYRHKNVAAVADSHYTALVDGLPVDLSDDDVVQKIIEIFQPLLEELNRRKCENEVDQKKAAKDRLMSFHASVKEDVGNQSKNLMTEVPNLSKLLEHTNIGVLDVLTDAENKSTMIYVRNIRTGQFFLAGVSENNLCRKFKMDSFKTSEELDKAFWNWYTENSITVAVLTRDIRPKVTSLFERLKGRYLGHLSLIPRILDVETLLVLTREASLSTYMLANGVKVLATEGIHHKTYASEEALVVAEHVAKRMQIAPVEKRSACMFANSLAADNNYESNNK